MINGILFHINGPLHKKLLEDFTVREVKGRMCEDCLLTPADNTESIDHGGVWVRPHQTVRVHKPIYIKDDATQTLQIHLVDNAGTGRHNQNVLEGLRTPLQG